MSPEAGFAQRCSSIEIRIADSSIKHSSIRHSTPCKAVEQQEGRFVPVYRLHGRRRSRGLFRGLTDGPLARKCTFPSASKYHVLGPLVAIWTYRYQTPVCCKQHIACYDNSKKLRIETAEFIHAVAHDAVGRLRFANVAWNALLTLGLYPASLYADTRLAPMPCDALVSTTTFSLATSYP